MKKILKITILQRVTNTFQKPCKAIYFCEVLPNSLLESLKNVSGFDEESFIKSHENEIALTSIRLNDRKLLRNDELDFDEISCSPVDWCNDGFYLSQRPFFTHDPMLHAGAYYVQEASSMFLWQVCNQIFKEDTQRIVLDLCAAPGGKSSLLSSFFKDGLLVSNEVIKQRCNILVENITKWGNENVVVTNNDAAHFKSLKTFFDVIVLDAPCSGSGLFRKDKESIKVWSEDNVNLCNQRQKRITAEIIDCLANEGVLIYSTCSYSKQENEDIVDWILANNNVETIKIDIKESWGIVETLSDEKQGFGYRFYPNKVKGEGFFIAAFKNKSDEKNYHKFKEKNIELASKQEVEIASKFIINAEPFSFFKHNENIRIIDKKWLKHLQIISNNLFVKKAGVELGFTKKQDLIPSHELATSNLCSNQFKKININKLQALQYLAKKEVIIDTDYIGWVLLQYKNINLGWVKMLGNRMNNYYPVEWRVLNTSFEKNEN